LIYLHNRRGGQIQTPGKDLLAVGNPDCYSGAEQGALPRPGHETALRDYFKNQGFLFSRLPHAETEVREIASLFRPEKRTLLLNVGGTEGAVKRAGLQDFKILHFACHGFIDDEEPLRSALVLAFDHGGGEDGFLQAREIGSLQLNAELVVLSACRTAHGNLKRGEGVLDLSRCFFRAGARTVIASLWRIDDHATSLLMRDLYVALVKGSAKTQALRAAKLRMIHSGFSHPFFWAGFVLSGEGQSTLRPDTQSPAANL